MRRLTFALAAVSACASVSWAQRVPGRELLDLPIGAFGEAPALAIEGGDGFRNPAALFLGGTLRARASLASMITGADQSVDAQLAALAVALRDRTTIGLTIARAAVSDIPRTVDDPTSAGGDVPYSTLVLSAAAARRTFDHVVAGLAVRYRTGVLDTERHGAIGVDGGVIVDGLTRFDVRLGASSFLWRPGTAATDRATISTGADARIVGRDSLGTARVGYAFTFAPRLSREHFSYVTGRLGHWVARAGVARTAQFGDVATRLRLAVGLHYARYTLGVAREDNPAGLAPTYQFLLSTVVP